MLGLETRALLNHEITTQSTKTPYDMWPHHSLNTNSRRLDLTLNIIFGLIRSKTFLLVIERGNTSLVKYVTSMRPSARSMLDASPYLGFLQKYAIWWIYVTKLFLEQKCQTSKSCGQKGRWAELYIYILILFVNSIF